jgi:hypothetical protein
MILRCLYHFDTIYYKSNSKALQTRILIKQKWI